MTLARRETGLLKVEEARRALAACKSLDEVKAIRDQAQAIAAYLRTQKAGAEAQNDAAEIKLRAERRLGELDEEREKSKGAATPRGGPRARGGMVPSRAAATLAGLGIDGKQAKRWREVARVPEPDFEAHLAGLRRAGERVTTAALTRETRRAEVLAGLAEKAQQVTPLSGVKPCPVVYADPPWAYENATATSAAAVLDYATMSLADICALPVPATPDAVLFLWVTSPLLPQGLEVIRAWGFSYKASMVWDKGSGTGNWVLNAHELLLIGVRGDIPCPAPANRPVSVVRGPTAGHSEKPEEFAALIDRMYPGLPKVEMFGRKERGGLWTVWGNQVAA